MRGVVIRGDGVAAYGCAHLLKSAGFQVAMERADRPRLPAIMLSEAALALIRDVFEQPALFRDLPRIERRVVAWGPNSKPLAVDHSAVVVSEQVLLESIGSTLSLGDAPANAGNEWTIYSSKPLPPESVEHRCGSRTASAAPVNLKYGSDRAACWIESLEDGWLFLISNAASGWLLSVGGPPESLLGRSRIIAGQIERVSAPIAEFPAYPRIVSPLCGPGWLACGTAAMAFDPLCGDGTANAIREAILACAVIRAAADGARLSDLFSHYEARLTAGFRRHLLVCGEFYKSGHGGGWWRSELESIERGAEWCARQIGDTEFHYQLRGFELQPVRGTRIS